MKYLVSCLLVLPLITSCVEQDQYYESNYYNPAPRVEVERNNPNYHHHNNGYYRPAPQGRAYHGHTDVNRNRVMVNPRASQGVGEVQHNIHGQGGTHHNNVAEHPPTTGGAVVVQENVQGNVHGHDNNVHGKPQQPVHAHDDTPETTHGHN
ncbi:hypothetical protein [Legionella maioricensis]|uniref:Uncharacterized protein n=1 Tax=Legionella maioricensis TaxID=2896528 RepID=A0A9X2ICT2_9GAMM|nr:hypothetical protein [Legionella maioricensis]MCL9685521.1 hypothetical protein [Legionella maioricensis]MCL9688865.1 hypothetical protein [Legionella maioricensis]